VANLLFVPFRSRSNPLALAVLACLAERPMHPYEIAKTLRERHKDASIRLNYGSLYAVVNTLLQRELILAEDSERPGNRPERTVYRLTDAGRHELTDWLGELLSVPVKEYTQYEAGLSLLAVLPPEEVVPLLQQRCSRIQVEQAQAAAVRAMAVQQKLPRLFWLEAEFSLALRTAELDWTQRLLADIESNQLDGLALWQQLHESDRNITDIT
jgi:DNA-binding PadR family transcriptional regulator